MKFVILLSIYLMFFHVADAANDWGKTGHRATGEIAQKHLSEAAKKAVNELLDGKSLALVSTYADEIKSDVKYKKYGPWHYVNFPFDSSYNLHPKSEKGDIIVAIETSINKLKDTTLLKEDKAFYLNFLVHLLGDLHQPLHIGLAKDKGGNDFQVRWFNNGTNLHTVWDTKMIESYNMSYTELAKNVPVLSKDAYQELSKGTVIEWMMESRAICKNIYATTRVGDKLGYKHMYDYMDTVRLQLQKGGIRLASILNEVFS